MCAGEALAGLWTYGCDDRLQEVVLIDVHPRLLDGLRVARRARHPVPLHHIGSFAIRRLDLSPAHFTHSDGQDRGTRHRRVGREWFGRGWGWARVVGWA